MKNKVTTITGAVIAILTVVSVFNTDFDLIKWKEVVEILAGAVTSIVLLFAGDPGKKESGI